MGARGAFDGVLILDTIAWNRTQGNGSRTEATVGADAVGEPRGGSFLKV